MSPTKIAVTAKNVRITAAAILPGEYVVGSRGTVELPELPDAEPPELPDAELLELGLVPPDETTVVPLSEEAA